MAATTLSAILAAWATLLEGTVGLTKSAVAFTHDNQPNGTLDESYYLTDEGNVDRKSVTNSVEVRIDRVTVWIAKPMNFAGDTQLQAMEDVIDTVYRHLLALALTAGYNVEADTRRITHPKDTELIVASATFRVDFDFSSAVV